MRRPQFLSFRKGTVTLAGLTFALCSQWAAAQGDCFEQAAAWQHVNADILRAFAQQESSNNPAIKHRNSNRSTDYGLMGINSVHLDDLSKFGIGPKDLMNPCVNIFVSAWLYAQRIREYGNTWDAVGAYHSKTEGLRQDYAGRIYRILESRGVTRGGPTEAPRGLAQEAAQAAEYEYALAEAARLNADAATRLREQAVAQGITLPGESNQPVSPQPNAMTGLTAQQERYLAQVPPAQRAQVQAMLQRQIGPQRDESPDMALIR